MRKPVIPPAWMAMPVLFRPSPATLLALLILPALILSACAGNKEQAPQEGVRFGRTDAPFTGQWWEYYERGLAYARAGLNKQALADFDQAIGARPDDQWHVRTSGNTMIDYFPHRERGITLFRQRRFEDAITELRLSIDTASSARARAWLTRIRGTIIKRDGSDLHPPELVLERSTGKKLTNAFSHVVRGRASDDTYLTEIRIGDVVLTLDPVVQDKFFEVEIPLEEGDNTIKVEALDLAGKSTVQTIELYRDLQGPQIEIDSITVGDKGVTLIGGASDDTTVSLIKINHRRWPVTGRARGYSFNVLLPDGPITVLAGDRTGNLTRAVVRHREPDMLTESLSDRDIQAENGKTEKKTEPDLKEASTDTDGPVIWLRDLEPELTSYRDTLLLKGMINDASMVTGLALNNRSILIRNGHTIYFSMKRKLKPGVNTFLFQAEDEHGNRTEQTITVHREIPQIMRPEQRLAVALLPLDLLPPDNLTSETAQNRLFTAFAENGRFNLLPQQKIPLPDGQSGLYRNPARAAETGRQAGAPAVLTGMLIRHRQGVELVSRLIDTATGAIMATNDAFSWNTEPNESDTLFQDMAEGYSREFPVVKGSVVEVHGDQVLINIGAKQGVKPNTEYICYRDIPPVPHPVTGQLLESEPRIIGSLKVEAVYDDQARATFIKRKCAPIVSDQVIAR